MQRSENDCWAKMCTAPHESLYQTREHKTIFEQVLGPQFDELPERLKRFHGAERSSNWKGHAEVYRGKGLPAKLVCQMFNFPPQGSEVGLIVNVNIVAGRETWTRDFGGRKFSSDLQCGEGKYAGFLTEMVGPFRCAIKLKLENDCLHFVPTYWDFVGIPLPKFLIPAGESHETEKEGKFYFNIEITLPFIGLIVAYRGNLEPND